MRAVATRHGAFAYLPAKPVYQNYMEEEFYVTVLDADTLLFQMRLKDTDGILTTSTQIFSRLN